MVGSARAVLPQSPTLVRKNSPVAVQLPTTIRRKEHRLLDDYDGGSDQFTKGAHAGYAAGIVDAFHRFMNETQGIRPAYAAGGRARGK